MSDFDARLFMASVRKESGLAHSGPLSVWELLALLRLEGTPFLRAAYQGILFREADPVGSQSYAKRARTLCGRIRILLALLTSPENIYVPPFVRWIVTPLRCVRRIAKQVRSKREV